MLKSKWQEISIKILFENDDLIALDKPENILTQGTVADSYTNLYYAAQQFLIKRSQHSYLALHHRLDKGTSGIILFAKTKYGNQILSSAFQNKTIQKIYIAKTIFKEGFSIDDSWEIQNHLAPLKRNSKNQYKHGAVYSGGQKAITKFKVLNQVANHHLLIQATPITGRTHQIRAHLSEYKLPILGDSLYSDNSTKYPRLYLHAHKIRLSLNESFIEIESPLPKNFNKTN